MFQEQDGRSVILLGTQTQRLEKLMALKSKLKTLKDDAKNHKIYFSDMILVAILFVSICVTMLVPHIAMIGIVVPMADERYPSGEMPWSVASIYLFLAVCTLLGSLFVTWLCAIFYIRYHMPYYSKLRAMDIKKLEDEIKFL